MPKVTTNISRVRVKKRDSIVIDLGQKVIEVFGDNEVMVWNNRGEDFDRTFTI